MRLVLTLLICLLFNNGFSQITSQWKLRINNNRLEYDSAGTWVILSNGGTSVGVNCSNCITRSFLDSTLHHAMGDSDFVWMVGALVPTWNGLTTSWSWLRGDTGHEPTTFFPVVTYSSGLMELTFPTMDSISTFLVGNDDEFQKSGYQWGAHVELNRALINGSYIEKAKSGYLISSFTNNVPVNAAGGYYTLTLDTTIMRFDLNYSSYGVNEPTIPALYSGNLFGATGVYNALTMTEPGAENHLRFFYPVNPVTGNVKSWSSCGNNDNFYVEYSFRKHVLFQNQQFPEGAIIIIAGGIKRS